MKLNNKIYQERLEKTSSQKRDIYGYKYFGDKVSSIVFSVSKKHVREPVLDVGAGTGALVKTLKSNGYKNVLGIDLYPKVSFIKKGEITDLKFKDSSFNTVFCSEVLEHLTVQQINKGVREIKRVLKPDGRLIVTVPYTEVLEENRYICPKCGHKFHKVGHLQSFDEIRIKKILEVAGFEVISIKVYAFGAMAKLPFGRYFNWLFKRLDYQSIGKTMMVVAQKR